MQSPKGISPETRRLAELAAHLNARPWSEVDAKIDASGVPTCKVTGTDSDQDLRGKLSRLETDIAQARDDRKDLQTKVDQAKAAFAGVEGYNRDSDEFQAAQEAVRQLGEHDDKTADMEAAQVGILKLLNHKDGRGNSDRPSGDPTDPRGSWNSAAVFEDEQMRAVLQHMSSSKAKVGPVQLGEIASREALVTDVTGSANMRRSDWAGILPQLRRQLRVLDLIPTSTMDSNSIPYTQESGSLDTATETAEGGLKPESAWVPTDQTADAQTIAHWLKIRKQVLADFPALQGIIDNRLRYGVERRLEGQILVGDGSGSNLRGILATSGIGAVAYDGAELPADQILVGITNVLLADGMADGAVMHPTDWANTLKAKASGDGHYYSGGPFSVTPQIIWGIPLVPSKAITLGMVLVGDFAIGAQLFIREGVNVLLSDSDQDDFIRKDRKSVV